MSIDLERSDQVNFLNTSLRAKIVIVLVLFLTIASLLYYLPRRITAQRDKASMRSMFQNTLVALHNYRNLDKRFPPPLIRNADGTPLTSWRLAIVNEVEARKMPPFDLHKPWSDTANAAWHDWSFPIYCLPSASTPLESCVFAIVGPGTVFGDPAKENDTPRFGENDTIMLIEVSSTGKHWMEPVDFHIDTMPREYRTETGPAIGGRFDDGFFVGLRNGDVYFLSYDTPFADLEKFFTLEGAEQHDFEELLGPYILDRR